MQYIRTTPKLDDIEEEKEISNVVGLTVVGGKDPPQDGDWLTPLDVGSIFLVRSKTNLRDFNLGLFRLMEKISNKTVTLRSPSLPQNIYVYPIIFCSLWSLHENLGIMEDPKLTEEVVDDGDRV